MDRSTTSRSRPVTRFREVTVAVWLLGLAGAALMLADSPAIVGFSFAVVTACTWCFWLDQHGTGCDTGPVRDPDGGLRLAPRAHPPVLVLRGRRVPTSPVADQPASIEAA